MKLSVIGAGKVGKTLCRLWSHVGVFEIGDVLNRRPEHARIAADFIGAGKPVATWADLGKADLFMIAVPDDAIAACAERLAEAGLVGPGVIAFHCSGSKSSSVLAAAKAAGADVASLHPVKTFADPRRAAETFAGTYCALEGDPRARAVLQEAVERGGGRCFGIDAEQKLIYHAATVFLSNYVVALLEVGLTCFEKAGMTREDAVRIGLPLVRETVENVASLGTLQALTGPIARGDSRLVAEQLRALLDWNPEIGRLYAGLGLRAVEIAKRRRSAEAGLLDAIEDALARLPS